MSLLAKSTTNLKDFQQRYANHYNLKVQQASLDLLFILFVYLPLLIYSGPVVMNGLTFFLDLSQSINLSHITLWFATSILMWLVLYCVISFMEPLNQYQNLFTGNGSWCCGHCGYCYKTSWLRSYHQSNGHDCFAEALFSFPIMFWVCDCQCYYLFADMKFPRNFC